MRFIDIGYRRRVDFLLVSLPSVLCAVSSLPLSRCRSVGLLFFFFFFFPSASPLIIPTERQPTTLAGERQPPRFISTLVSQTRIALSIEFHR